MFEQQLKYDLFRAYYDARRNKRNTWNQLRFEIEQERKLLEMWEQIVKREYEIRPSIAFIVNEPVKREIFAADFSDRVVHHLLFNYLNPILDAQFIKDSYSCREGKGTHYGIKRVSEFMRLCSADYTQDCFVLKLDIKGYFMGMNKHLLWEKLEKMFGRIRENNDGDDREKWDTIWYLLDKVIWNDPRRNCIIKGKRSDWDGLPPSKSLFHSAKDSGLPIGNLTSQLFSNVYLHDFDCFVKNDLGVEYYGRYVDDFVLMHRDKAFLLDALGKIKRYLTERSALTLHPNKIYLQHYSKGFAFLGAYIKPYRTYVGKRTKKKFLQMLWECEKGLKKVEDHKEGAEALGTTREERILVEQVRARINSYLGIMGHYSTYNIRRKALLGKKNHAFFKYGYLEGRLKKFTVYSEKWDFGDIWDFGNIPELMVEKTEQ